MFKLVVWLFIAKLVSSEVISNFHSPPGMDEAPLVSAPRTSVDEDIIRHMTILTRKAIFGNKNSIVDTFRRDYVEVDF